MIRTEPKNFFDFEDYQKQLKPVMQKTIIDYKPMAST